MHGGLYVPTEIPKLDIPRRGTGKNELSGDCIRSDEADS